MECCIEWSNYKETEKHARLCKRAVKQRPAWDLHLCWLFPQSLIFSVLWADFLSPYLFPSIKVSDDSWQSIGGKRIILLKGIYRGHWGFPSGSEDKESTMQCRRHRRCEFALWVGKIPWRRVWLPIPVFLLEKSHGQRSLADYSPKGHKESDVTEQLSACTADIIGTNTVTNLIPNSYRSKTLLKQVGLLPPPFGFFSNMGSICLQHLLSHWLPMLVWIICLVSFFLGYVYLSLLLPQEM